MLHLGLLNIFFVYSIFIQRYLGFLSYVYLSILCRFLTDHFGYLCDSWRDPGTLVWHGACHTYESFVVLHEWLPPCITYLCLLADVSPLICIFVPTVHIWNMIISPFLRRIPLLVRHIGPEESKTLPCHIQAVIGTNTLTMCGLFYGKPIPVIFNVILSFFYIYVQ